MGSEVKITSNNIEIFVSENINKDDKIIVDKNDSEAPEFFEPITSKEKTIFNDKYFLVFNAQDKDSGIDHYEICEGKFKCVETEKNYYVFKSQKLDKEVMIKAFDKNNNYRLVIIPPKNNIPWYKNNIYFAIILLGLFIVVVLIKKRYKKGS